MSQVRSRDGTTILKAVAPSPIPGARLRTLPGQTHSVAAAVLAPVLKEFFAS